MLFSLFLYKPQLY